MLKLSIYKIIIIIKSLYSIIHCKIQKITIGNYLIVQYPHSNLDLRSKIILDNSDLSKSLNILRFNQLNYNSLLTFLNTPNSISFSIFKNSDNKKFFKIYVKHILKFIKIKKFIMIDDYRVISQFNDIFKELKIFSLGYMHGRLPLTTSYLKNDFNIFLVWSSFFKKILIQNNKNYKDQNVIIIGRYNFKKKITNFSKKNLNLMITDEDFVDLKKIRPYLTYLKKIKNINIYLKKKISRELPLDYYEFCKKSKITIISEKYNFEESLKKYEISKILAFSSTALLDAIYYDVIPIKIDASKDLLEGYKKFKLFFYVNKPVDLKKFFNKENKYYKKKIAISKKKLWSNSKFNNINVKKGLKFIYN